MSKTGVRSTHRELTDLDEPTRENTEEIEKIRKTKHYVISTLTLVLFFDNLVEKASLCWG